MDEQVVLCVSRHCLEDWRQFTPWNSADSLLRAAESGMKWLPRSEAEASDDYVQPIPCALILGERDGYYVFRRIREGRADLRSRLSLVIGGHIDWESGSRRFPQLVSSTLTREIAEELRTERPSVVRPVGIVVDHRSHESSRHIGVVHEVVVKGPVRPVAAEEFSLRSQDAGRLCSAYELSTLRRRLDPWSSIIFDDYVAPTYAPDIERQGRLL